MHRIISKGRSCCLEAREVCDGGQRLAASLPLEDEKGAVMGRHTHGDGGRRRQGPKPGPLMPLGTWPAPPHHRSKEGFYLDSGPGALLD